MRKLLRGARRTAFTGLAAFAFGVFAPVATADVDLDVLGAGYWKNHLANKDSGGPFHSTECNTIREHGGRCSEVDPWAIQYLPQSLGNFPVSNITTAADTLASLKCGKGRGKAKDQNAIGCLAGQLLATKLNLANGSLACPGILQAAAEADAFLKGLSVDGVPGIFYVGPTGSYPLTDAQRELALDLKDDLDGYNSGFACP